MSRRIVPNQHISIHALLAESDAVVLVIVCHDLIFLSTLSLRRATLKPSQSQPRPIHFYPRSPCGERLFIFAGKAPYMEFLSTLSLRRATFRSGFLFNLLFYFYPRSPCGERLCVSWMVRSHLLFLSTLSLRRATRNITNGERKKHISIHALLAESDPG